MSRCSNPALMCIGPARRRRLLLPAHRCRYRRPRSPATGKTLMASRRGKPWSFAPDRPHPCRRIPPPERWCIRLTRPRFRGIRASARPAALPSLVCVSVHAQVRWRSRQVAIGVDDEGGAFDRPQACPTARASPELVWRSRRRVEQQRIIKCCVSDEFRLLCNGIRR